MLQEICLVLVVLVITYFVMSFLVRPKGMPPCHKPLPVIGNLLEVARWMRQRNMHLELKKLADEYHGKIFTLRLPGQDMVVVNSAATAREALLTKKDDFAGRPYMFIIDYMTRGSKDVVAQDVSTTLLTQRKIIHSAIRLYLPKLENKVNKEIEELSKRFIAHQGKPVDPAPEIALTTLNVICAMVYGERYEIDDPEFKMIGDYHQKEFYLLSKFSLLNIFPFLIHFPINDSKLLKGICKTRDSLLDKKYRQHKETYQDGVTRDLTDALIKVLKETEQEDSKARDVITEDHIVMTMADAFTAGFETTCTTIMWFLLLMIRYPHVQAQVQSELDRVIGKENMPKWEDRGKLPYTSATIEEAQRIATVIPILLPHKATKDSTLEGYKILKDTTIMFNVWAIHHDEKEWENPYVFNPERFLDDDGNLINVAGVKSFIPFGAGRRVCVGEALAKKELFLITTQLLHQFTVESEVPGSPPSMDGELKTAHYPKPFKACFKLRSR